MDDLAIVALYHRRAEQAITESDKKYGGLCRAISLELLGIREDAEECVNDTWNVAWNRMPPDRPQALGAFFGRITRNLSISRWRRDHARKRYSGMEVLLSELADCVPGPDTVEQTWERQQLGRIISTWLDSLTAENRQLFVLRYWYGEPVKKLAAQWGEKPNTLSRRLLRLREDLRIFLESKGVEP